MKFSFLISMIGLFILPFYAKAQISNPNFLPLGDIEGFMGNAGSAGVRSPGAVFYNPGAVAEVRKGISINGSNFMKFKYKADPVFRIDSTNLTYTASAFAAVPISIINIYRVKKWVLGFSYLMPNNFEFENNIQYRATGALGASFNLMQTYKAQDYMIGLTAARQLNKRWSMGLTIFGNKHYFFQTVASNVTFTSIPNFVANEMVREKIDVHLGNAVLGLQYRDRRSRYGLSFRTPSFVARSKGSFYKLKSEYDGANLKSTLIQEERVAANFKIPPDLLAGYSTVLAERIVWAADIGYQFGTKFRVMAGPGGDDNVGRFKGAFRFRTGLAYKIPKVGHVFTGFAYTPSTKEDLAFQEAGSKEDYKMFTLGLRVKNGNLYTGIGSFFAWAKGNNRINNYPVAGQYDTGNIKFTIHGIILNAGYQM